MESTLAPPRRRPRRRSSSSSTTTILYVPHQARAMETILAPPRRRPRRCCSTTTTILHVAHAIIETILAPPRLHPRRRRRRRCSSTHGSTATMCRLAHRCSYRLEGVCKIQSPKGLFSKWVERVTLSTHFVNSFFLQRILQDLKLLYLSIPKILVSFRTGRKLLYLSIPKILVSFRTLFSGILAIRPLEPLFQRKSRH